MSYSSSWVFTTCLKIMLDGLAQRFADTNQLHKTLGGAPYRRPSDNTGRVSEFFVTPVDAFDTTCRKLSFLRLLARCQ